MEFLYVVKPPNNDRSDSELSIGPVLAEDPNKLEHGKDYWNFAISRLAHAAPLTEKELKERIAATSKRLKDQFAASADARKAVQAHIEDVRRLEKEKKDAAGNVSPAGKRMLNTIEKNERVRSILREYSGSLEVLAALTGDVAVKLAKIRD
jgi:molecular chaperone GrpE (heat shock protein)